MIKSAHRNARQSTWPTARMAQPTWRWTPILLLMLLAATPRPSVAAEPADTTANLTGLADTTLGVSQVTPAGVQCGLQLDAIGTAAHRAVADAGIIVRDDSTNRATISAVTTRVGADQCATAVMLGVYAKESFFSASAGWIQSGYVVLWQRSMIVATPVGLHAAAVIDATRRLSDQMLTDWRARNPTPAPGAAHSDNGRAGNSSLMATQTAPGTPKATQ